MGEEASELIDAIIDSCYFLLASTQHANIITAQFELFMLIFSLTEMLALVQAAASRVPKYIVVPVSIIEPYKCVVLGLSLERKKHGCIVSSTPSSIRKILSTTLGRCW